MVNWNGASAEWPPVLLCQMIEPALAAPYVL